MHLAAVTFSFAAEGHTTISQSLQNLPSTTHAPMAVLIPRIRTINVRLSEEEYLELERLCVAVGARSISDFVRNAMHSVVTSGNPTSLLASSVNEYSAHVRDLEQRMELIAAELASFRAGMQPQNAAGPYSKNETLEARSMDDAEISAGSAIVELSQRKRDS
jgi:hypothetical protein